MLLAGCATSPVPVLSPCGVIHDSLQDVHATTKAGDNRISTNFERGVAAGCWERLAPKPIVAPKTSRWKGLTS